MSLKKIAKSINNLADAIRYHADKAAESDTFVTNDHTEAECYEAEGFETPKPLTEAQKRGIRNDQRRVAEREGREYVDPFEPKPLTVAEANYVDPYDQPVNAPGWQTLTVEDLDNRTPPPPPAPEAPAPEAPAPEAPAPEAPAPEAPAGAAELDSAGMPWDERIHSSGKSFLADGTWRLKRGVDDETMQAVTDELKKVMAIPAPPSAPEAPQGKITTLAQFAKACTDKGIGAMMVTEAVKEAGLESTGQLGARPDLIPQVAEALQL